MQSGCTLTAEKLIYGEVGTDLRGSTPHFTRIVRQLYMRIVIRFYNYQASAA